MKVNKLGTAKLLALKPNAKNIQRGFMRIYKNTTNEYYFITWKDKKPVNLYSAIPNVKSLIRRRAENGNNNAFMCPTNVIIYNKTMGGTDVFHQKMQYYFPYIRTPKWTRRVIMHFIM